MATHDHKTNPLPRTILLAAVTVLAAVSAMAGMVNKAAGLGPQVGDLISFDPARHVSFDSVAILTAVRPGQTNCELDLAFIQRSGGSLVVEQRGVGSGLLYSTHWAGAHTSDSANDCGADANLMLSRLDINTLAMAAGGFGVNHASVLLLK